MTKLPWIPTDAKWVDILAVAKSEPIRNRVMLVGLRRLAAPRRAVLAAHDLDPAYRTLRMQPETTKNRLERFLPCPASTGLLLSSYFTYRANDHPRPVNRRSCPTTRSC